MKAVIQRVTHSSVTVCDEIIGCIGSGLVILLGVVNGDTEYEAELLAGKIARLRIFCDEHDKMNLSIMDTEGAILVVSQFTLCADCKKGNRPSFAASAEPKQAEHLYKYFIEKLYEYGVKNVETGIFAANMKVEIINDGPVTIVFDTDIWLKKTYDNSD